MQRTPSYFAFISRELDTEDNTITLRYEIGFSQGAPLSFKEVVHLPDQPISSDVPQDLLENLLDDVHLMLGISYYKLYCPPEIRTTRPLSDTQALFWETVYRKGLGEFAYRNNLDLRETIRFPRTASARTIYDLVRRDRALVGIGGGKDSIVALELLKERDIERDGFVVETYAAHDIADSVCEIAGIGSIKIRRMLDEQVFERLPDSFSGHIPISAVYAFMGVLACVLYDYRYVVTGNEYSSNFGNVEHFGEEVNHQWSKSAEFEDMFNEYLRAFTTPSVRYFSIVRPFYEIRIAKLFAGYPRYFPYFTSCNRKFRIEHAARPRGMWCCECPKCAFVFLMFAPFIPRDELVAMFGRNMLDDKSLIPLYQDILGFGTMKPFDCVGTFDEAQAALYLSRDAYADSAVMQEFLSRIADGEKLVHEVMGANRALSVPTRFRFSGMKNILILGHGKEGRESEAYIHEEYPDLEIGIADEAHDPAYLERQAAYDMAVKTPGIPKEKVHMQYVTATNIFFSEFKGMVIGVTGSKGKSTTASLIHHMLSSAGKDSRLVGNIGEPMLKLLRDGNTNAIVVAELSSYQLDDIEFSPHIAVATALFPEHMDYHGSETAYYEAKRNIVRFQKGSDVFVYNPAFPELEEWTRETRAISHAYDELPFSEEMIPLLGAHNVDNVRAAVTVARLMGVKDKDIESAVRSFKGLSHRLEFVGEFKGIRFYDDAISTTPESTIAALRAVPGVATIFLGGHDRGYDFAALESEIRALGIKNIVLFPESGARIFSSRDGFNILETSSMEEAVTFAYESTPAGSACLLSTASPSYGVWKDFEEKGDEFKKTVLSSST